MWEMGKIKKNGLWVESELPEVKEIAGGSWLGCWRLRSEEAAGVAGVKAGGGSSGDWGKGVWWFGFLFGWIAMEVIR